MVEGAPTDSGTLDCQRGDRYEEVLAALYASRRAGIDLGLGRMRASLSRLGLEKGGAPLSLQVAGTNGKGSTAQFLSSILSEAGFGVGVFSSPHLLSLCERFSINKEAVSRSELVRAYRAVCEHVEGLTFFEQVTAMAAWLFRSHAVDVAIYEVGLGGRLDSTSAIDAQVGVVTGIARDHCEYLGSELVDIAREKAGIFRSGAHAVIGLSASRAIREFLRSLAQDAGAKTLMVEPVHQAMVPEHLRLAGAHQRKNAAGAVAAAFALRECGLSITDAAIGQGLAKAELAGRLQEVEPGLWVDGAHNAQAAAVLAAAIAERAPWVLVVGLSSGKEVSDFLEPLRPTCEALIATEADNDRALPAADIARAAHDWPKVEIQADLAVALARARELANGRPIVVTGSLLLVGEVLRLRGHGRADPFVVSDPGGGKFAPESGEEYP